MGSRRIVKTALSLVLIIVLFAQLPLPRAVSSQAAGSDPAVQQPAQEMLVSTRRGEEKLSADLRVTLGLDQSPGSLLTPAAASQILMVSAVVQPGADVERYFTRSARSRTIAGFQWVNGEVKAASLLKLASHPGVRGIFSTNTYQTAQAPGLDDLRAQFPRLEAAEVQSFLAQGGPGLLRQRLAQEPFREPGGSPAVLEKESRGSAAAESTAPGLLEIHDVASAWEAGYTGEDVVVAVVDTGVDFSHPDLQGTHAVISQGAYAGWPFAYDVMSGAQYAMAPQHVLDPTNIWSLIGLTQYARTLPVTDQTCSPLSCEGWLTLGEGEEEGSQVLVHATWPNTSKSGNYRFTIHPDYLLFNAAYYLNLIYPNGWMPAVVIVADENAPGKYDTVYVDINFDGELSAADEKLTRDRPVGGADLTGDGVWDLSAGLLAWISDGYHHPPGVAALYPDVLESAPPAPGELLAFVNDSSGHGTNCASEIVAQGQITDPQGLGPTNPSYAGAADIGGVGTPVIRGVAPGARIAAFQNGFRLPLDAWTLAVMGMEGDPGSGNGAQIISNSWGDSKIIADGWDSVSRFAQLLSYEVAPAVSFLAATGNGGHGYGTGTSPAGGSILDVGASTAYGALKVFEMVTPEQFVYGDVQPWSNRGPGALGDVAPDVVAAGAWGTGAQPLNYYFGNGQAAYDVFGGTSMSTPVTAGVLSLVYQAFRAQPQNQRWPTWEESRSILLNGAQGLGYDVFAQGAGNIQAGRSVEIAAGRLPRVEPQQWRAGNYQGQAYPAFPSLLREGEQDSQQFTITNPTDEDVTFTIAQNYLVKQYEETFTVAYAPPAPSSTYRLPVFLKDITDLVADYDPALVRAQVSFPYDSFDVNDDHYADNWWSAFFYDWQDRNQDQNLWVDANRNGMVDESEIDIDPASGIYEFNRFTYGYPQSTRVEASLGRGAIEQKHDGIFLGLDCNYCGGSVTLLVRLTFYEASDWDWLTLSTTSVVAPAGGQAVFSAALAPFDASPGVYESAIEVRSDVGGITIPVVALLAASSDTFQFGAPSSQDTPYDNAEINGGFNWDWRYESGDWRYYYFDIAGGAQQPGKSLLVETHWDIPHTDIDTWVLGNPPGPAGLLPTDIFGPQSLGVTGGSEDSYLSAGKFAWKTNTGTNRELAGAPYQDGLGMVALHNVLSGGGQPAETFTGSVFGFSSEPGEVSLALLPETAQLPYLSGQQSLSFTSTGDIAEGVQVRAYGFSVPEKLSNQVIRQNSLTNICSAAWVYPRNSRGLKISHAGLFEITTTAANPDLDLDVYLFKDDGDGIWNCSREKLAYYSVNSGPDEHVKILFPNDAVYWVLVHGYAVPQDQQQLFDIEIRAIQGTEIQLRNLPVGPVTAGQPVQLEMNFQSLYQAASPAALEGLLLVGPPAVPALVEVPIRLRPTILISPEPVLNVSSIWVVQEPRDFWLSFQNQGTQAEDMQVQIALPEGLVYHAGTAIGPGSDPQYDPAASTLTWSGEAPAGGSVDIFFQASAQPGYPAGMAVLRSRVAGSLSGQEWLVETAVCLNHYGLLLPFVAR